MLGGVPPALSEQTGPLTRTPYDPENELMNSIAWCPKWGQVVVVCVGTQCLLGGGGAS